jgi:hypothetical protein
VFEHEDVPPLAPGAAPIANDEQRHDPIVDGFERIEVEPIGSADEDAYGVAERPQVRLAHARRLEVSFDPGLGRAFLDPSKNVSRRGLLGKRSEVNRREVNHVQTRRRSWSAARHIEYRRRSGKLFIHEGEKVPCDVGDLELAITLPRPHPGGTSPGTMNKNHVRIVRRAAWKPNPASSKGLAPHGETKNREPLFQAEGTLLERNPLGVGLSKKKIAEVPGLTRKGHRSTRG